MNKTVKTICVVLLVLALLAGLAMLAGWFMLRSLFPSQDLQPLPIYATDGTWSLRAVEEEHSRLYSSIENLKRSSDAVVRVRVVDMTLEEWRMGDTDYWDDEFTNLHLEILEVYHDSFISAWQLREGTTIGLLQINRIDNRRWGRLDWDSASSIRRAADEWPEYTFQIDWIRVQFDVGDELVLFLNYGVFENEWNTYWPSWDSRYEHQLSDRVYHLANPIQSAYFYPSLESVNPYNNLTLTHYDLQQQEDTLND